MHPEEQKIHEIHDAWIDAVNAGDLQRLLALMAEDAVFLSPVKAPMDREAFAAAFPVAPGKARIHCTSDLQEVVVVGEVAYARSRDALAVTPGGSTETRFAGDRMTIYRRQPDGRWLLARDIHTLTPE